MAYVKVEFSDDISTLDYTQICRACLLQEENLISIFSEKLVSENVISIVEMITACASIQLFEGDGFPSQLCSNCFDQLRQSYAFRQQFEKANATLHNHAYKRLQDTSHFLDDTQTSLQADDEPLKKIKDEEIHKKDSVKAESEKSNKNLKQKTRKLKKIENIESKSSFQCKKCGDKFESNIILRDHIKEQHPYKKGKHKCTVCSKSFIMSYLKEHMRSHTQEKPYACNICGLTFTSKGNLRRHKMIHTGERPHKCPICKKGFIQSFTLAEHLRVHTRETPFQCTICSKKFAHSSQFRLHVKRHDEPGNDTKCDTKFLCSECGKSFTTIGGLKMHAVIHLGIKPYQCTICNKSFRHALSLKTHSLLHTGEKPFSCSLCQKVFTQSQHLKCHLRTHTGEKPYECSFCGKGFASKGNMTVHARAHTGETPYHCSVCGKGFYDSSSMKKHQKGHEIKTNAGLRDETVPQD